MATIADLDTEIKDDLANAAQVVETAITDLTAKLAAANVPVDVTAEVDQLKSIAAALRTATNTTSSTTTTAPAPAT